MVLEEVTSLLDSVTTWRVLWDQLSRKKRWSVYFTKQCHHWKWWTQEVCPCPILNKTVPDQGQLPRISIVGQISSSYLNPRKFPGQHLAPSAHFLRPESLSLWVIFYMSWCTHRSIGSSFQHWTNFDLKVINPVFCGATVRQFIVWKLISI